MLRALILAPLCSVPLLPAFGQPAQTHGPISGAELLISAVRL